MAVLIFLAAWVVFLLLGSLLIKRGHRRRLVGDIEQSTIGDAQRWAAVQGQALPHLDGGGGGF